METEIIKVDPKSIKLLEINARYMDTIEYNKLVSNIKKDQKLTTVPFCQWTSDNKIEVLSGNHRVMAAVDAGLDKIEIMICKEKLSHDQCVAIQLSHNSIEGKDDKAILKELFDSIENLELKEYSGISNEMIKTYDKMIAEFSIPAVDYQILNLVFAPLEIEQIKNLFDFAQGIIKNNSYLIANFKDYEEYMSLHTDISKAICIKNSSTVFLAMLELARKHIEELKDIWIDKAKQNDYVPISTILGRSDLSKNDALTLNRAVELMLSRGEIEKGNKSRALRLLSDLYLKKHAYIP